jgi:hypothetical protein
MSAGIALGAFFLLLAHITKSPENSSKGGPGFECAVCERELPERKRAQGQRCRRCWVNMTNR